MHNFQPDDLFAERFRLRKQLGQGGFSDAWLAYNEMSGTEQVLKIYTIVDDKGRRVFLREFTRVNHLMHAKLLRPSNFDFFEERPYLVLPYCGRGSIWRLVGKLGEREIGRVMRDICGALAYIHQPAYRMVHRDIKPDNILLADQGHYLLADFGISWELREELFRCALKNGRNVPNDEGFSPGAYLAPECFGNEEKDHAVMASDIWALGATLYELASGHPPYGQEGVGGRFTGQAPPDLPSSFSWQLNALLKDCMAKDPAARPSAESLRQMAEEFLNTDQWPVNFFDEKKSGWNWKNIEWSKDLDWVKGVVSNTLEWAKSIQWTQNLAWMKSVRWQGWAGRVKGIEWEKMWKPWMKTAGIAIAITTGLLAIAAILAMPRGDDKDTMQLSMADTAISLPDISTTGLTPEKLPNTVVEEKGDSGPFRDMRFEKAAAVRPDTLLAESEEGDQEGSETEMKGDYGPFQDQHFEEIVRAATEQVDRPDSIPVPVRPDPVLTEGREPVVLAVKESAPPQPENVAAPSPQAGKKTEKAPAGRQPAAQPQKNEKAKIPEPRFNELTGKWGYVDNTGNWLIWPQFDEATSFSEGQAMVMKIGNNDKRRSYYIDLNGKLTPVPEGELADGQDN